MRQHADDAKAMGKPLLVEEFGKQVPLLHHSCKSQGKAGQNQAHTQRSLIEGSGNSMVIRTTVSHLAQRWLSINGIGLGFLINNMVMSINAKFSCRSTSSRTGRRQP